MEINKQLDELENRLPAFPAAIIKLQRAVCGRLRNVTKTAIGAASSSIRTTTKAGRTATKTVVGQGRAAATDVVDTAKTSGKTVAGQARAQTKRTFDVATDEIDGLADDVVDETETLLEGYTRSELYERAQERDIAGRSSMNKTELIEALKS